MNSKLVAEDAVRIFEGRRVRRVVAEDHPRDRQLHIITFIFSDDSVAVLTVSDARGFEGQNRTLGGEK